MAYWSWVSLLKRGGFVCLICGKPATTAWILGSDNGDPLGILGEDIMSTSATTLSATTLFALLLREFRQRAGLSRIELAAYLNVEPETIHDFERGNKSDLLNMRFYNRLGDVPEFSDEVSNLLQKALVNIWCRDHLIMCSAPAELIPEVVEIIAKTTIDEANALLSQPVTEEAPDTLTESLLNDDRIPLLDPEIVADPTAKKMEHEGDLLSHEERERQHSNKPEQDQGVPKKGDIFKRKSRTHYDPEFLRTYGGDVTERLVAAVENNDPVLRPLAEQALQSIHLFAEADAKAQGASLSQVSREHNIPLKSLSEWVRKGLLPVRYKDKNTIYLPKATAQETGRIHREAKGNGLRTAPLLKEMHDSLFSVSSVNRT
jgi:transcriptional regulator with XRE-family HTH domain